MRKAINRDDEFTALLKKGEAGVFKQDGLVLDCSVNGRSFGYDVPLNAAGWHPQIFSRNSHDSLNLLREMIKYQPLHGLAGRAPFKGNRYCLSPISLESNPDDVLTNLKSIALAIHQTYKALTSAQ